ncbi:MAG: hypothetical protein QM530_02160 [Phycisphaerales bacterium]|nr:hypothetical protein [Phycisphaerales bacterium]
MIFLQLTQQLMSLKELLSKLRHDQYVAKINHLGNASIGGHTRHIIELLQCTINGYYTSEVDYLNRVRDIELECNLNLAQEKLASIASNIPLEDKSLRLTTERMEGISAQEVISTYYREIVYNVEHIIHHLALIKVALVDMNLSIVDHNFGMAYSTLKYKEQLMQ